MTSSGSRLLPQALLTRQPKQAPIPATMNATRGAGRPVPDQTPAKAAADRPVPPARRAGIAANTGWTDRPQTPSRQIAAGQGRGTRRRLPAPVPRLAASLAAPSRRAGPLRTVPTRARHPTTPVRISKGAVGTGLAAVVLRNAARARDVDALESPELAASGFPGGIGGSRADNLAPQGRRPATIGSQAHPGEFPVPVLSVVSKDSPRDVPGRAARQVEYQV